MTMTYGRCLRAETTRDCRHNHVWKNGEAHKMAQHDDPDQHDLPRPTELRPERPDRLAHPPRYPGMEPLTDMEAMSLRAARSALEAAAWAMGDRSYVYPSQQWLVNVREVLNDTIDNIDETLDGVPI